MKVFFSWFMVLIGVIGATIAKDSFFGGIKFFSNVTNLEDLRAEIKTTGKPGVVFVTQPGCHVCTHLLRDINKDENLKDTLNTKFVTVHNTDNPAESTWQHHGEEEDYVPRVYFVDTNGKYVTIAPANPETKHFFGSAAEVANALRVTLEQVTAGEDL